MHVVARLRVLSLAMALLAAPAAGAGELVAGGWAISPPSPAYPDLPSLAPDIAYDPANDLSSLVFACDRDRFFLMVVAPGFPFQPVNAAKLTVGDGGPQIDLSLRDLYGDPVADAPKIDWDASVLWSELAMEDLSEMASVATLVIAVGERRWTIGLEGFEGPAREFLTYCATGEKAEAGHYRPAD